jgi:hypothetical protein
MNKAQKVIVVLALALLAGMTFYPPWIRRDTSGAVRQRVYSFILTPPRTTAEALPVTVPANFSVDGVRLLKGWLCVAGLALPLTVLLRTRRRKETR